MSEVAKTNQLPKVELPTIAELFADNQEISKQEGLMGILNTPPPKNWIKQHPIIKVERLDANGNKQRVPYEYLPIDKVEFLLKKL